RCCSSVRERAPRALHSFPTRRSSDLEITACRDHPVVDANAREGDGCALLERGSNLETRGPSAASDRALRPLDRSGVRGEGGGDRSEEHTSELQSRENLVCRLLLEKRE